MMSARLLALLGAAALVRAQEVSFFFDLSHHLLQYSS